jgi:hypothetical protein
MIRFHFRRDDLLHTRFALSPLLDASHSLAALRDPARSSVHLEWVRTAREATRDLDLALLHALVPDTGYVPDFISPPPETPLPDVPTELERVRRTSVATMRQEIGFLYEDRIPPPVVQDLLDHPRRGLRRLADLLGAYWDRAFAPHWEQMRAVLEDDIAHRARLLTSGGPLEVFDGLHPDVSWRDGSLVIDRPYEADVHLEGRGLLLVPSLFTWPRAGAMIDPPWQPTLIYPPRGVGLLWAPERRDHGALRALLGDRRARILEALEREATTTTLARRMQVSPASVSEHLTVLHDAGLVRRRRDGRAVFYARTATGDALLTARTSAR